MLRALWLICISGTYSFLLKTCLHSLNETKRMNSSPSKNASILWSIIWVKIMCFASCLMGAIKVWDYFLLENWKQKLRIASMRAIILIVLCINKQFIRRQACSEWASEIFGTFWNNLSRVVLLEQHQAVIELCWLERTLMVCLTCSRLLAGTNANKLTRLNEEEKGDFCR